MMCIGVGFFGFILVRILCFLDLFVSFLPQTRKVFSHYFIKCVFYPSLFSLLGPLCCDCWYVWCCPKGSLNYLIFFKKNCCCSSCVFSTTLPSRSPIHSSAWPNLLLISFSEFFISVIIAFISILIGIFFNIYSVSLLKFCLSSPISCHGLAFL